MYLECERFTLLSVENEVTPLHDDLIVTFTDVNDGFVVGCRIEVCH
jgi:hypothetical protein